MAVKTTIKKEPVKNEPAKKELPKDSVEVVFTKEEVVSMVAYIEDNLIAQIRDDPDWDNFMFTKRIFDIWGKLEAIARARKWGREE